MSVLTHLQRIGSNLILNNTENESIRNSVNTLNTRLTNYFPILQDKFIFGSFDRKTILPRNIDENSDVDYMVIFNDGNNYRPQTLLTRLRNFVDARYSTSDIYQSSPTIVLQLNHIKFELVPSYKDGWSGTIYIPAPSNGFQDWISTNPQGIKDELMRKNYNANNNIKPLIRLLKYWNVRNNKVYSSYELEKFIIDKYFLLCSNLKDYFFDTVQFLPEYNLPEYKRNKVLRLKEYITSVKTHENNGRDEIAERVLNEIIPDI